MVKKIFSGLCSFFNVRNVDVDIVCDDCGRNSKLCSDCDEGIHSYCPMHDRYTISSWRTTASYPTTLQSVSCAVEIVDYGKLKQFNNMFLELFSMCIWLSILLVEITLYLQNLGLFAILGC